MQTTPVNCNNCGAPLEVSPGTNFVTCGHCGSRLAVRRAGAAAYTELLEKLDKTTEAMAEQLGVIARQNEVARIDREWEEERQAYLVTDRMGGRHVPTAAGAWVAACALGGLGLFWLLTMRRYVQTPPQFMLTAVVMIVVGAASGYWQWSKAEEYRAARARYEKRRAAALLGWRDPVDPPPA